MNTPTPDIHRALGRVEGKLDAVLAEFRGTLAVHGARLDGHDADIEGLKAIESERVGMMKAGKALWFALAALAGAVSSFVLSLVAKFWGA